jgi:hypothetical protein
LPADRTAALLAPASAPCILSIGQTAADNELLRLIVSTLRGTRLELADSLPEARRIVAGQPCRAIVVDAGLVPELLAGQPLTDAAAPFVIGFGEAAKTGQATDPRIGHWQAKPMKIREVARILRALT